MRVQANSSRNQEMNLLFGVLSLNDTMALLQTFKNPPVLVIEIGEYQYYRSIQLNITDTVLKLVSAPMYVKQRVIIASSDELCLLDV